MKNIHKALPLLLILSICMWQTTAQSTYRLNKSFPWAQIGAVKSLILKETELSLRSTLLNAATEEVIW